MIIFTLNMNKPFRKPPLPQPPPVTDHTRTDASEVVSFFKTLLVFVLLAFLLRGSVVEAFKIPSESMKSTLLIGDHILVCKFSYGFRLPLMKRALMVYSMPKRGDVVVFTRPDDPSTSEEDESKINIIKRVVGLPGDMVEVRERTVFINGAALKEPYAQWLENGISEGNFAARIVPDGRVFLLGDNRDHSKDSRFWYPSHFLDIDLIKGRALMIYWSWQSLSRIGKLIR